MRKINSKFLTNFISEEGSKLKNKDYFAFVELDNFAIYVVADGIDNDDEKSAAKIAVANIIRRFSDKPSMKKSTIKNHLENVNDELINESNKVSLKCSITILLTDYYKYRYVSIGNSRFYLYRDNYIKEKSKDQSLTEQLVGEDKLSLDKIAKHQERNNLYCYLGQLEKLEPYISKKSKFKDGDIALLLTRGIWENLDDGEILDTLEEASEPKEMLDTLEELILSKQLKELENYTLGTIFVNKRYENPKRRAKIKKAILIAIPIILAITVALVTWYFIRQNKLNQIENMNQYIESADTYVEENNYIRAIEEYKEAINLSKKLKDTNTYKNLDGKQKFIEKIIEADELLKNEKFAEAQEKYLELIDESYYKDRIAEDYINNQLLKTNDCIKVSDLISDGDFKKEQNDNEGAKEDYKGARDLANNLYLKDLKNEAEEKLRAIEEEEAKVAEEEKAKKEKEEEENKAKEEEEKKQEEEAKKKQEENEKAAKEEADRLLSRQIETQQAALEVIKLGDNLFAQGKYEEAKMHYITAQEMYSQVGLNSLSDRLKEKITIVDSK